MDTCNQWLLLQQSPEVVTVKEVEEYRPGRVRHRYTTRLVLISKVQIVWHTILSSTLMHTSELPCFWFKCLDAERAISLTIDEVQNEC